MEDRILRSFSFNIMYEQNGSVKKRLHSEGSIFYISWLNLFFGVLDMKLYRTCHKLATETKPYSDSVSSKSA